MPRKATCRTCGGTGWQVLANSWFPADGFRRERCGICGGTGHSSYRDLAESIRRQAYLKRFKEECGGLVPRNETQAKRALAVVNAAYRRRPYPVVQTTEAR